MSEQGGHIRDAATIRLAANKAWEEWKKINELMQPVESDELAEAFRTVDLCLTHALYLEAMAEYIEKGGRSRGSFLITDTSRNGSRRNLWDDGKIPFNRKSSFTMQNILEISLDGNNEIQKQWVAVRPIPERELWFEKVWKEYWELRIDN